MYLMLAIGIPVFLVFGGALLALAFSSSAEEEARDAEMPRTAKKLRAPTFFIRPAGQQAASPKVSADKVVSDIEAHLRQENKVAKAFADDPCPTTLWLDQRSLN